MHKDTGVYGQSNSYAHAVKIGPYYPSVVEDNKAASVLDDSCTLQSDLSLSVVGKLKKFDYLSNLKTLLVEKGFVDIIIRYMGGFWASNSFKIDERVTWIDIEGVPLCKFFWIRAKEVIGWSPNFNDGDDDLSNSDDESLVVKNDEIQNNETSEVDSEVEEIPETILNKHFINNEVNQSEGESKYPPGFTPRDASEVNSNMEQKPVKENNDCNQKSHKLSNMKKDSNASLNEDADASVCSGNFKSVEILKSDGSILQLMLDLIKVGETMGYKMNGCINNFKEIVKTQGAQNPSVGNSRGILCVWDPYMFRREHSTVSDYFIAIMGKWSSNDKNLIIILVYAPQELSEKKMLWQYLNHMIHRWKGDVIVMGDFNVVRTQKERFCSIFNPQGAATFNSFISSGGLVEVSSGGYSFTWSHKSASKMKPNAMLRLLKKLKVLKMKIRVWNNDKKDKTHNYKNGLKKLLVEIDSSLDKGDATPETLEEKGAWIKDPKVVKNEFLIHFKERFNNPCSSRFTLDMDFPNKLSTDQVNDLERPFTKEDIKATSLLKPDVVDAANHFYTHGFCPNGGFLDNALKNFGFGDRWCDWIQSCLRSSKGSILVNGSLTFEFQFHKGLKQVDPLSTFLFILVMESLHLSFQKVIEAGLFKGLRININKSKLLGVGVENSKVDLAATNMGCLTLKLPFTYLGVKVGGRMT
nr:RNA-directed DNA polymerase, eukaryota [Tanacetum cinerariifolium]